MRLVSSFISLAKVSVISSQNSKVQPGSINSQAQYFCFEFFFKSKTLSFSSRIIALVNILKTIIIKIYFVILKYFVKSKYS